MVRVTYPHVMPQFCHAPIDKVMFGARRFGEYPLLAQWLLKPHSFAGLGAPRGALQNEQRPSERTVALDMEEPDRCPHWELAEYLVNGAPGFLPSRDADKAWDQTWFSATVAATYDLLILFGFKEVMKDGVVDSRVRKYRLLKDVDLELLGKALASALTGREESELRQAILDWHLPENFAWRVHMMNETMQPYVVKRRQQREGPTRIKTSVPVPTLRSAFDKLIPEGIAHTHRAGGVTGTGGNVDLGGAERDAVKIVPGTSPPIAKKGPLGGTRTADLLDRAVEMSYTYSSRFVPNPPTAVGQRTSREHIAFDMYSFFLFVRPEQAGERDGLQS